MADAGPVARPFSLIPANRRDALLRAGATPAIALAGFAILLFAYGKNPLATYWDVLHGTFGSVRGLTEVLVIMIPLMFCALAVAIPARIGMVNIADPADHEGSGYPQLNTEYLIQANPDFVFLADTICCGQTPASFAARPGFSVLGAVRNHRVFGLEDSLASQWGPRVVDFLRTVVGAVVSGTVSPRA